MAEHHAKHVDTAHHDGHAGTHAIPTYIYYRVFAILMILLVLTLAAAALSLGPWNLPIAMAIAVAKAVLILLYFMHLRFSSRLVQVFGGAAVFWLLILFALTLSDYFSRG